LSTQTPSLASSIAIRQRLLVGFSLAIRTMIATISGLIGGRPSRFDFHVQTRAKPWRSQRTTTIRASFFVIKGEY
jgi:hypothetical protein